MVDFDTEELLHKAVAGDRHALGRLLLAYQDRLIRVVARNIPKSLARSVSPEDIAQLSSIDAIRGIQAFRPAGPDSFWPWLRAIAKRRLQTAVRFQRAIKRGGGGIVVDPTPQPGADPDSQMAELLDMVAVHERTPSRSAIRREGIAKVLAAVELPAYREAVQLHHLQGLSVTEVAARMGRTPGSVQMLCNRGLKALARQLGPASDFLSRHA